jgi:hypothetical protein
MAAKQSRSRQKMKVGHRAHKRDSVVIPEAKAGQGRDARKKAKRAALAAKRAEHEALMAQQAQEATQ